MPDPEPKIVMLAGASGLVGKSALDVFLDSPDTGRVFAITRRPLGREHSRLANRIVQFENIETQLKGLTCHVAVCCLGTTIGQAGSEAAFRRVDVDYVLSFARTAKAAQAQRFIVVSSAGADTQSKNFYLRTKGEMEEAVAGVGFTSLDILQPGPLLSLRSQMRPLELGALPAQKGIHQRHDQQRTELQGPHLVAQGQQRAGLQNVQRRESDTRDGLFHLAFGTQIEFLRLRVRSSGRHDNEALCLRGFGSTSE